MKRDSRLRILVRSPNWIGDQVLAYPFFHTLRQRYPTAEITAVCPAWVESIQFLDCVDRVVVAPRVLGTGAIAKLRSVETLATELRKTGKWDLAFSLPRSFSSAWLLFRARAQKRVGYSADSRRFLLTDPLSWDEEKVLHRSSEYLRLLGLTDLELDRARHYFGVPPENDLDPGIPGRVSGFEPGQVWPNSKPLAPPDEKYWVLAPGSAAESRRWPVARFADLARRVHDAMGIRGLIVGGPKEASLAVQLTEDRSLQLRDYTGQGPVADLWQIFRQASFTVSNDSGLAHIAALCGSPTQVVWGAGDPKRTSPLGPARVRIAFQPVECWPCERNTCGLPGPKKMECLTGLSSELIWTEVQSGLKPS